MRILSLAFVLAVSFYTLSFGAGYYPAPSEGDSFKMKEMKDGLDKLRHQINNQETELKAFEEKLESIDSIVDSMREQTKKSLSSQKEQLKGSSENFESRLAAIESMQKALTADLKKFQTFSSETASGFQSLKEKISAIEQDTSLLHRNIDNLQLAMNALTDAMQMKIDPSSGGKSYQVKNGDSLEKIAKAHGTTIKAIKELNGLTSDKIIVGAWLKIP